MAANTPPPPAPPISQIDADEALRFSYDDANRALRTRTTIEGFTVDPINVNVVSGGGGSSLSTGLNGAAAPTSSTEVATKRATDGTLQPLTSNALNQLITTIADPLTGVQVSVQQFHNADNQNPGVAAQGLLTGGVAQLKNVLGNLDRQTETGLDTISALGISSGAAQLASPFSTTSTTTIAPGTVVVTPASMTGGAVGAKWAILVGSVITVDVGAAQEVALVTAVTGATFTALFTKAHGPASYSLVSFVYNQTKDATLGDNAFPAGIGSGAQYLLNSTGTYNRQRETAFDNIPSAGIATGTQQTASPFTTSSTTTLTASASPQVATPIVMSGTVSGSPFSIQPQQTLLIDSGTNQEKVQVISVTATTFTAVFTKAHGPASYAVFGFVYNQARDSTIVDGSPLTGIPASGTYLFNTNLNAGAGGVERERSASGELDNASGQGSAIAVEYEFNGATYDRARSVQGKMFAQSTISAGGTNGSNSLTLASAPTGLTLGAQVRLFNGTTYEGNWVGATFVAGSTTVPLQNLIVNGTHTTLQFEAYSVNGPGLNGFMAFGVGIEEEALWDPVSQQFYIERAATQDGMPAANIVAESGSLWNGTSFDRERNAKGDSFGTALADGRTPGDQGCEAQVGYEYGYNGTSWDRLKATSGALNIISTPAVMATGSIVAAGVVFSQDAAQYQSVSIMLTSIGAGNVINFQVSNDNVNWFNAATMPGGDLVNILTSTATSVGTYTTQINSRYFRVFVSTFGSGTITATAYFKIFGNSPSSIGGYVSAQLLDSTGASVTLGQKLSASSLPMVLASDQSAVPVKAASGTLTDNSGTTSATVSTSTQVMAANAARRYLIVQNPSTNTATIWINFTSAASVGQPSFQLLPGSVFVQESNFVSTEAVNILSSVASVPFTAKQG